MPSKTRHGLIISIAVVALLFSLVMTTYSETTTYVYDELNRLIGVIYEDGSVVIYTYDASGNRITVGPDTVPPTGTIIINSGEATTNNPSVTLTLTCSDNVVCSQMQFSNDNVTYSTPETYGTTKSWTLSEGYGTKTVYAKFKDAAGNWSTAYSDTIEYVVGWLAGWSYRKSVTLSRPSGLVTNYQMKLLVGESAGASGENVDCNGHIQADFNDLRFTTSDGSTLLNYWIESITGTTPNRLATVWIKIDSVGTSETTFYMYYGKSGATAYSNGDNTFTFFDDFSGSSLDTTTKWNVLYQTGSSTITVNGGILSLKAIVGGSSGWTYCWIRQKSSFTRPYAVNVRWKEPDPTSAWAAFNPIYGIINGGEQIGFERQANSYRYWRKYISGVSTYILSEYWSTDSAWHLHEFLFTTTHFTAKLDGTIKVNNHAQSTPSSGTADLKAVDYYAGNTHESQFDYIFVRNYNSPEPAWGSWGAEEAN